jgi:carbamoyltransferase
MATLASEPVSMSESTDTWVFGLGGSAHDYSAALACGLDIQVAIERERLTRVKYGTPQWFEDPFAVPLQYCLEAADIERADVARTVSSDLLPRWSVDRHAIQTYDHHLCHAASATMLLSADTSACVMVYDFSGSLHRTPPNGNPLGAALDTFSFFEFKNCELQPFARTRGHRYMSGVGRQDMGTNSMGLLYELVTSLIGFDTFESGKTMGLAAWGEPRYVDDFLTYMRFGSSLDGVFDFDPFTEELQDLIQRLLSDRQHSFGVRADLAATVQELLTRCLVHCYELVADRDFEVFCIAGGCGLNTVANGVLAKCLGPGRKLLIPPHAGDAGIALGSLWLDAREHRTGPFEMTLRGKPLAPAIARPGRSYSHQEVRRAAAHHLSSTAEDPVIDGPEALARLIASGAIVGVFNGGSEIGPRALGGRSIIADPRDVQMKERINRQIKHREPFRPLAPILLAEHFDEYFSPRTAANPYMLVLADGNDDCRRWAPAVIHVDGTARVQVLDEYDDPFLVRLLREFHSLTGVGVLLNTSFNRRGEPIVETPDDAVRAFVGMELDGLWLDGIFLCRAP